MKSVFILEHLHILPDGEEDVKMIGAYDSREMAEGAVGRLTKQNGFRDHPGMIDPLVDNETSGFYIDECEINKDNWAEGYISVIDAI